MWGALEWIAWALSALIFLWMAIDGWRTGESYSEDMLLSSREGLDELMTEKKGG